MRPHPLKLIFIFLVIFSCSEVRKESQTMKENWTEAQKRKYFQDSIAYRKHNGLYGEGDSLNNFSVFYRKMFPDIKTKYKSNPFFYALEEPYIDTTEIDSQKFWIRILITPTFRNPYCLVVEKKNQRTYVVGKVTDGSAGYYSGLLDYSITTTFSDTLYDDISKELKRLNFTELVTDSICNGGDDGDTWIFEVIENGNYKTITRWTPLEYGDATTRQLASLGLEIEFLSGLFFSDVKEIQTHRLKKKYGLKLFKKNLN